MRNKYTIRTTKQKPNDLGKTLVAHKVIADILKKKFRQVRDLYNSRDLPEFNISLPELIALYTVFQILGTILQDRVQLGFPKDKNSPEIDDGYIKIGKYRYVVETVTAFTSNPNDNQGDGLYSLIAERLEENKFAKSPDYPGGKHLIILTDDPLKQELPIIEEIVNDIKHDRDVESYWLVGVRFERGKPYMRAYHYDPDAESLGLHELRGEKDFLHGKIYQIPLG